MVECMTAIAEGRLILVTGGWWPSAVAGRTTDTVGASRDNRSRTHRRKKNLGFVLGVNRGKHGRFEDDIDLFQLVGQINKM